VLQAYKDRILPRIYAFKPHLLLISAGFDAHLADPLAELAVTTDDFRWVTAALRRAAHAIPACQGRIVSVLEGGYDLEALAESTLAHIDALEIPEVPGEDEAILSLAELKAELGVGGGESGLRIEVVAGKKSRPLVLKGERTAAAVIRLAQGKFKTKHAVLKTAQGAMVDDAVMAALKPGSKLVLTKK